MSERRLEKTKAPGIFRRHAIGCKRSGRCDCSYVVIWRHRGRQHKESHRTFDDARQAQGRRRSGDRRPTERVTFAGYWSPFIDNYSGRTSRGFTEATRREYRRPVEAHALPVWGSWQMADIGPADVRDLFAKLVRDGLSLAGVKKLRAPLSAMFATAVEDGVIRSNPMVGVRLPSVVSDDEVDEKSKALTRVELSMLLDEIEESAGEDWRLFFDFLAQTGLRISEAIGLRWHHLDLTGEKPHVKVREQVYESERRKLKTKYSRRDLPLSPSMTTRLLAKRRDDYRGEATPVFASAAGTELRPANVYRRVLAPAAVAVGLSEEVRDDDGEVRVKSAVSFHAFRHTCASMLFAAGRNIKQVSRWLGHADAAFTLRTYVHLMDEGIGDADLFDAELAPKGATPGATQAPEKAANDPVPVLAGSAV